MTEETVTPSASNDPRAPGVSSGPRGAPSNSNRSPSMATSTEAADDRLDASRVEKKTRTFPPASDSAVGFDSWLTHHGALAVAEKTLPSGCQTFLISRSSRRAQSASGGNRKRR